jgi:hypothetical protein
MLMPEQQNSFTHLKVLLVLTDRGILAQILAQLASWMGGHLNEYCIRLLGK